MIYLDAIAGPSLFWGGSALILFAAVIILFVVTIVMIVVRIEHYIDEKRRIKDNQNNNSKDPQI